MYSLFTHPVYKYTFRCIKQYKNIKNIKNIKCIKQYKYIKVKSYQQQGFTLIELLLALGIMAIFALLAYRGLDSVLRLHQNAYERQQYTQAIDRTLTQLNIDLRQANDATLIAIKDIKPNAGIALRIKRRVNHEAVIVQWFLDGRQLIRTVNIPKNKSLPSTIQTAIMLQNVDRLNWLISHTAVPEGSTNNEVIREWQKFSTDIENQQVSGLIEQLYYELGITLTLSGKTLDKYFLIGR
ncbi:MAG: hypothetical protein RL344_507 [Pseudomonadota bacterium]|jgi:prepilin-type N-terminal cleavage/methylation domain-containing protein